MTPASPELGGVPLPVDIPSKSGSKLESLGIQPPQEIFRSILFSDGQDVSAETSQGAPEYSSDLNLDQIVEAVTAGRDEYDLKPFFWSSLASIDQIHYRQEAFRDLENRSLLDSIQLFAGEMRQMRARLAQAEKIYYKYQKQSLFLDAVAAYCGAVSQLARELSSAELGSRGFQGLRAYLIDYVTSDGFHTLAAETELLRSDLNSIQYSVHINGKRITVARFGGEPDFSTEVLRTFEKFRQEASKDYQFKVSSWPEMNHVEAAIMDRVARLFPEIFARLERFPGQNRGYLDNVIARFDRDIQFYTAWIAFKGRIEASGLRFCYPTITASKDIHANDTFDLALADNLIKRRQPVVTNSFSLDGPERILVISGPYQGGKTTFARMFGQLHHLACLGSPVPGTSARLFLFDRLFTHFERQEDLLNLSGKLENELQRIRGILERATGNSVLIMNESFLSTILNDALFLSKQIMNRIIGMDMLCVTVTFLDELSTLGDSTVSMVSSIDPQDPAIRTFKIVRRPADGRAYAAAIAQKYHLSGDAIMERIEANAERSKSS
jgi:DNA mismatch repair protein MutS